ncbi:uncharacterized protein LOC133735860 [Rosa rugosa]|uniref:uncharacterized protein LOC133735860 n=1 Tax=Rosa rugosa TaxID=74645 RepID=UPI002B405447|nr:uncharacterized protein LOC133735860 [Rosa rugosa]
MEIIGDALRQAFMPKREYESLREEDRAWGKLQRPVLMASVAFICLSILACAIISLNIVFPADANRRPFCGDRRLNSLPMNVRGGDSDSDSFNGAFYLTDQETVDYYWMVVFIPSMIIFLATVVYLVAGITVAYSAPTRNGCLMVVENNYCASKRGGVRCLSILNAVFAIIFGLLALFLGTSLLTLGGSYCSVPLFWCYEIGTWGLVFLYGGTAFFLRRRSAVILDEGEFGGRNLGLEMLENPVEVTPDMERRVEEGFKTWMGSSLLSSDEEDEPESY